MHNTVAFVIKFPHVEMLTALGGIVYFLFWLVQLHLVFKLDFALLLLDQLNQKLMYFMIMNSDLYD